VREADNLATFTCRMSWKSGSLNLLEPFGPHQACYGTALPLPIKRILRITVLCDMLLKGWWIFTNFSRGSSSFVFRVQWDASRTFLRNFGLETQASRRHIKVDSHLRHHREKLRSYMLKPRLCHFFVFSLTSPHPLAT